MTATVEQALERWHRIAAAITFRKAWPWRMRIDLEISPVFDGIELRVALLGRDIATGEEQWVWKVDSVPERRILASDDEAISRCIQVLLRRLVEHEFDECLLLRGEQMRDPHTAPGARAA